MWTEAQMQRRSRQDGRSENSVPDAKKSLPTGQLTMLRPEDGMPPTAGRGGARRGVAGRGAMGRGEAGWQLGGPSVPHAHAERRAGAASCVTPAPRHSCRRRSGRCHLPADTTPFTPEPQPASPSIWGSPTAEERATLTHVLVTTVLARRGDTPASVRGRIFHVKWPGRESVRGVSRIRSGLCKGPGVRAGGAEAGPLPHLVGAAHPAGHGGARTCPRLATWAELPGLGSSPGSPSWHGDLPQVTALREPRFLVAHMGSLVMAPRGPEEAAHRAPGPALGPRAPGSGGRPAQPSEVMRERDGDTEAVKLVRVGWGWTRRPEKPSPLSSREPRAEARGQPRRARCADACCPLCAPSAPAAARRAPRGGHRGHRPRPPRQRRPRRLGPLFHCCPSPGSGARVAPARHTAPQWVGAPDPGPARTAPAGLPWPGV